MIIDFKSIKIDCIFDDSFDSKLTWRLFIDYTIIFWRLLVFLLYSFCIFDAFWVCIYRAVFIFSTITALLLRIPTLPALYDNCFYTGHRRSLTRLTWNCCIGYCWNYGSLCELWDSNSIFHTWYISLIFIHNMTFKRLSNGYNKHLLMLK